MRKILMLLLVIFSISCSKRDLPVVQEKILNPSFEVIKAPEILNPNNTYNISIRVKDNEGIDSLSLVISDKVNQETILSATLYDDGAAVYPNDGDVIAFDGIFSQNILWNPSDESRQNFVFSISIISSEAIDVEPLELEILSLGNIAPQISNIQFPDVLENGFELLDIAATVTDSNGVDDIKRVEYVGKRGGIAHFEGVIESATETNSEQNRVVFKKSIDSTFSIGLVGEYELEFVGVDQSGLKSAPISKTVNIENSAPVLSNIQTPAQVVQPVEGGVKFLITVDVSDKQSIGDIKHVRMKWLKPDNTYSANSPFDLYDNGLPFNDDLTGWNEGYRGDLEANDGVYSITGIFDYQNDTGNYFLTFYAEDFAGNESTQVVKMIYLSPAESGSVVKVKSPY